MKGLTYGTKLRLVLSVAPGDAPNVVRVAAKASVNNCTPASITFSRILIPAIPYGEPRVGAKAPGADIVVWPPPVSAKRLRCWTVDPGLDILSGRQPTSSAGEAHKRCVAAYRRRNVDCIGCRERVQSDGVGYLFGQHSTVIGQVNLEHMLAAQIDLGCTEVDQDVATVSLGQGR